MPTPKVEFDYFLYAIGGDTSSNAAELLQGLKLEALDAERVWITVGNRKLPVWAIDEEGMRHVRKSKDYTLGEHYEFYRRNRATGWASLMPEESKFGKSPAMKQALRFIVRARRRKLLASAN